MSRPEKGTSSTDCSKCDAYLATILKDDALRAEVAARWKMKPEQIDCPGCRSAKALFDCTLKQCATERGLKTCAHCTCPMPPSSTWAPMSSGGSVSARAPR